MNDTTRAMPTVEDIKDMADYHRTIFNSDPTQLLSRDTADMLETIAAKMRESEPVAWAVVGYGGKLVNCETEASAALTSKTYGYPIVPLYTIPFAEDARRKFTRNDMVKYLGGYLEKYCPTNHIDYDHMADKVFAAMKEYSHEH